MERLKAVRIAKGLRADDIAEAAGISLRSYRRYETGLMSPKVCQAIDIADALGVDDLRKLWSSSRDQGASHGGMPDMEQLDQMRVQQEILEKQVTVLETMIETHKLARFDENLGNLKTSMRKHLKLISSEFLVMEYDPENQRKILDLIDYLQAAIDELRRFTYVSPQHA